MLRFAIEICAGMVGMKFAIVNRKMKFSTHPFKQYYSFNLLLYLKENL